MDRLQACPVEVTPIKAQAVEDARQMQEKVNEDCKKAGKKPPPYNLEELIGKGSFGRVYKGQVSHRSPIKIIDIDESDTVNPRNADAYSDVLKEIGALSILRETKAKNINHVIEALIIGQSMWMITELCSGGSVATLMKPTFPAGLQEKWIIPILREVAEALKYVHAAGIIHRDIKCANVLITELGGVQLCDFGVAGIVENKVDKRSTIIGTPHWMAPELLTGSASYGKEVDIWAFGAMVYEIATGLPPNVANGIPYERLGAYIKHHVPRLEGDNYSSELRNLVAYCLQEDPAVRPRIEEVQKHPYIFNSASIYPTSSLRALVGSFKVWESRGGSRKSLFMKHGAQGISPANSCSNYEWNFSTTEYFDQEVLDKFSARDVYEAYGSAVLDFDEETEKPPQRAARPYRRRAPPEALSRMPAQPLEKIFDPNTLSNYDDNSKAQYGGAMIRQQSDLPLRDDSAQLTIKDTMIDLGNHDIETGMSEFPDMATIKAERKMNGGDNVSPLMDARNMAPGEQLDSKKNRLTQDWKFPSFPSTSDVSTFHVDPEVENQMINLEPSRRPSLVHHTTEPIGIYGRSTDRLSMQSLIDLDLSLPEPMRDFDKSPMTIDSGFGTSDCMPAMNSFELEGHSSMYPQTREREPSIYVVDDEDSIQVETLEVSNFSAPEISDVQLQLPPYDDSNQDGKPIIPSPPSPPKIRGIPAHPSEISLTGIASAEEMKIEFSRILLGMTQQLEAFRNSYNALKPSHSRLDSSTGQGGDNSRRNFTE
ncbi:hypothetical protein K3495_g2027 [Podosphaera aphanis]|nr:hypothetical protein K3495_g2027 [Podosphaera aphanis]